MYREEPNDSQYSTVHYTAVDRQHEQVTSSASHPHPMLVAECECEVLKQSPSTSGRR